MVVRGTRQDKVFPGSTAVKSPPSVEGTRYRVLYTVHFEHKYYNLNGGQCPDFRVQATQSTATLMKSLGLLLVDFGTGFSVVCPHDLLPMVVAFVKKNKNIWKNGGPDEEREKERADQLSEQEQYGYWKRLSFVLICRNPAFVGISNIPLSFNPSARNFYFSNQFAHTVYDGEGADGEPVNLLNSGDQVNRRETHLLLPQSLDVLPDADVVSILVYDLSGQVVMVVPGPASSPPGRDGPIAVDFVGYPGGLYTITYLYLDGLEQVFRTGLLTIATPQPMCFIDLLFCQPTLDAPGIYAVTADGDLPTDAVEFVLRFTNRSTRWVYYVAPQTRQGTLAELAIEDLKPVDGGDITFTPGQKVRLATGVLATPFTASGLLGLWQQSPYCFQLSGRREGAFSSNPIWVPNLPVAPGYPVLAQKGSEESWSEVYVYV